MVVSISPCGKCNDYLCVTRYTHFFNGITDIPTQAPCLEVEGTMILTGQVKIAALHLSRLLKSNLNDLLGNGQEARVWRALMLSEGRETIGKQLIKERVW